MATATIRSIRSAAASALLALTLAIAPGCSIFIPRPEAIRDVGVYEGLPCTPLALFYGPEEDRAYGSGVLMHPRVILTAGHGLSDDRRGLAVQAGYRFETAWIERIVDGGGPGLGSGDWALLVLEEPLETLNIAPAALPARAPELRRGDRVWITGFPYEGDGWDRRPLLIRTICIALAEPGVAFVRGERNSAHRGGASGGPVLLAPEDGEVTLAGILLGMATSRFAGVAVGQEMVIHTLPLDEIRRVIAEVEAEEHEVPGAAGS